MQFPGQLAPLVILDRDELAQQVPVVPAQVLERGRELVGRLAALANFRRARERNDGVVGSGAKLRQPVLELRQRPDGGARGALGKLLARYLAALPTSSQMRW